MIPSSPLRSIAARPRRARMAVRALPGARRGVAALEFALVAPLLLLMFGGAAELGLAVWARGILANAVSQGAYYASLTGPSVSVRTIKILVENTSSLSGVTSNPTPPTAYCASGSPVALTAPPAGNVCPDGTTPGIYTTISASYAMPSILPAFTGLAAPTLQESVTVRLQ
ncbi:MAG: TadE/TadG family type IV pilus assembly protein [Acetobacteraceae bacterium]